MPVYSTNGNRGFKIGNYVNANDKSASQYDDNDKTYHNAQLNNNKMTIEQLIDLVQADLTFSGMMPKVLPDLEIQRLIKEHALQWFYKNYQYALIKSYYKLDQNFINHDYYTSHGYITLPEECENVVKIYNINDPSLFRIGLQSPNLSIGLGVSNVPYLTSFVSNVGELGVYKSVLSAFSSELNKMSKLYNKYSYNPENKRLHMLGEVKNDLMIEIYLRIECEELFCSNLFKDYVIGLSRKRFGELVSRIDFPMPGGFKYSGPDLITQGQELIDKTIENVKGQSPNSSFFIMAQ